MGHSPHRISARGRGCGAQSYIPQIQMDTLCLRGCGQGCSLCGAPDPLSRPFFFRGENTPNLLSWPGSPSLPLSISYFSLLPKIQYRKMPLVYMEEREERGAPAGRGRRRRAFVRPPVNVREINDSMNCPSPLHRPEGTAHTPGRRILPPGRVLTAGGNWRAGI